MATNIGEAVIRLKFDGKDVKSTLQNASSEIQKHAKSAGDVWVSKFKNIGKAAIAAFAAAATAAGAFVAKTAKAAMEGFAEYEQLVGGVDTLFKDASKQVQKYADVAYKTAQISANDYMETVTSFSASLLQSLSGDTAAAAEYANNAVIDMADNANKMGTSMQSIQNAYQGFAKQNFTMLDNLKLGYGGTKEEMQRLLKDAEKLSGMKFDISSFADITQAIHVIQTEMGITGTSAEEASKTIQGSVNAMKSSWQNLMVGLANNEADFSKLMDNFIQSVGTMAENIIPVISEVLPKIGEMVHKLVPILAQQLPTLIETLLPMFLDVVIKIANTIIKQLPMILRTILDAFINALPDIVRSIVDALPLIIEAIVDFITDKENVNTLVDAAIELFMALVMAVPQILGGLIQAFGTLVAVLWDKIVAMFGEFGANFGKFIGDIFKGAINGVLTFIENFINAPIDLLNGFLSLINDAFGWIGVHIDMIPRIQLPRLAQGGVVDSATAALIGEDGKEAVIPLEKNTDNWAGLLASTLALEMEERDTIGSGGVNVYMNNEINNRLDAEDIGRVMVQSIRRYA